MLDLDLKEAVPKHALQPECPTSDSVRLSLPYSALSGSNLAVVNITLGRPWRRAETLKFRGRILRLQVDKPCQY